MMEGAVGAAATNLEIIETTTYTHPQCLKVSNRLLMLSKQSFLWRCIGTESYFKRPLNG